MCLVVHKSEVPQLLTEDKIVYKIIEFDTAEPCVWHAKYRTYKYTFGKLNKTILKHDDSLWI